METIKETALKLYVNLTNNYEVREGVHNGRAHMVVPVIMMVEGVHNGSRGPILYTTEELAKAPGAWNGVPVTIQHPISESGGHTSANIPEVINVGRVFNAHMEGNKLKAEVWVDIDDLKEQSSAAFDYLQGQRPLSVSVGVFSDEDGDGGEWNGESYRAEARALIPDHLALLPGGEGACSWDDGCGIRNNENKLNTKQGGGPMEKKEKSKLSVKDLNLELLKDSLMIKVLDNTSLIVSELGYREISQSIQTKLDSMDTDARMHFLEEVFDSNFIYRVSNRQSSESTYYKQTYQVESGGVEINNDAAQVEKKVTFELIQNSDKLVRIKFNNSNNKNSKTMSENKKGIPCKIDALIANDASKFEEGDREWLSTLEESVLDKMIPVAKEPEKVEKVVAPVVNEETIKKVLNAQKDPEAFIDNFMPEGMREQMKSGLKMYQDKRGSLIKNIANNSKFTEENLKGWTTEDLETLSDSVGGKVDYSALSAGGSGSGEPAPENDEMNIMLNIKSEEK